MEAAGIATLYQCVRCHVDFAKCTVSLISMPETKPYRMHALLRPEAVAAMLGVTVGQLRRIAKTERLPGQTWSKGKQLRWRYCRALQSFVDRRQKTKSASTLRTRIRREVAQQSAAERNRLRISQSELFAAKLWARKTIQRVDAMENGEALQLLKDLQPFLDLAGELAKDLSPTSSVA